MQILFSLCQMEVRVCRSRHLDVVGIQMKAREERL